MQKMVLLCENESEEEETGSMPVSGQESPFHLHKLPYPGRKQSRWVGWLDANEILILDRSPPRPHPIIGALFLIVSPTPSLGSCLFVRLFTRFVLVFPIGHSFYPELPR